MMRLTTMFFAGVLSLLAVLVVGVALAERLQEPRGPVVRILRVAYAPTFLTLDAMWSQGMTFGKNTTPGDAVSAGGLLLLTPVLYSGMFVGAMALFRMKSSANKQMLPIAGKPGSG